MKINKNKVRLRASKMFNYFNNLLLLQLLSKNVFDSNWTVLLTRSVVRLIKEIRNRYTFPNFDRSCRSKKIFNKTSRKTTLHFVANVMLLFSIRCFFYINFNPFLSHVMRKCEVCCDISDKWTNRFIVGSFI